MIFRRRQDEMEGFRRMREALRQQADPQDHALLEEEQYEGYDEESDEFDEREPLEAAEEPAPVAPAYVEALAAPTPEPVVALTAPVMTAVEAPAPPALREGEAVMTTIGPDTSWNGTLRSESNIYLEGKVEGTLEARDTIYIAERATVDARIKARSVVVAGQVTGHIDCSGRLEVTPTGRLNGEVETGSIVVHDGAEVDGKFKMKKGQAGG